MRRGFRMTPEQGDDLYEMEKDMALERRTLRRPQTGEFDPDGTRVLGCDIEDEDAVDNRLDLAVEADEDDEWADWLDEEDA